MRRVRQLLVALGLTALLALALLFGLNVFLNTWLLVLINQQPERMQMGWSSAWTWNARHVVVEGYTLRVQGPLDQWWLSVDRATLEVELFPLLERRFQADDVVAEGVVMRYRGRVDAPPTPGEVGAMYLEGRTAPIPGLENPPLERPEDLYPPPAAPWLVALDHVQVQEVRDIWLGDYRFVGTAQVDGELIVMPGASLDVSGVALEVIEGELLHDDLPVVSDLTLEVEGSLEGVDPVAIAGADLLGFLDATIHIGGRVDDLRYVDIFLRDAPWVGISGGTGSLDALLDVRDGVLGPASYARAVVTELAAQIGTYAAVGDGRVDVTVDRGARLAVVLDRFSVHQDGGAPLVQGEGFRLDATTPTLRLDEPPSGFTAVATLPKSEVPNLARFDRYLPSDIGLRVMGGNATVSGRARIEEDGDHVSGLLTVVAGRARLTYDGIPVTGSARLTGRVVSGSLDEGRYDIRGSAFSVSRVSVDGAPATWSARVDVREGRVAAEADTFLTTRSDFVCSDSSPFFRIAVGDRKVAPWIRDLVLMKNLRGEIRASFGQTSLAIDHMHIRTAKAKEAEVHLHLTQKGDRTDALLFARLGILGVATRVAGDEYTVQLLDAKRWYHARLAEAGTPEPLTTMRGNVKAAKDQKPDARKGIKIFGKDLRKLFEKKPPKDTATKDEAAAKAPPADKLPER